ncbi:MAG: 3-deoxy-D-manno-octulosonic acid transferase [Acidobacteriota bacterium]
MWILYQVALALLLLLAFPFLYLRRGRHYGPTLAGRLGRSLPDLADKHRDPLWIHAVSVGEVGVAKTFIDALDDDLPLVLTTITPTGQGQARKQLAGRAAIGYLPFDLAFAVEPFLRHVEPRALILTEGDYWPLVLRAVARRRRPIAVINGRVGDRSYARMRRLRPLLGPLLGRVERFAVQSAGDRQKLLDLGVPAERLRVTGNLKFETAIPPALPELEEALLGLAQARPILIAGSTMEGEDELVLDAFEAAGDALLIIAPRHPERWDEVERLLTRRGRPFVRRSRLGTADGDIVLLDSLGELAALYRLALGAFIGGTLVPTGGHNPIEPARFGTATVVGPSMENFRQMAQDFDRADAWQRAADAAHLGEIWRHWVADRASARALGERAAALVESNRGALTKTLEWIAPVLAPTPGKGQPSDRPS